MLNLSLPVNPTATVLLAFLIVLSHLGQGVARQQPSIPESLMPWVDWVLHDKNKEIKCVVQYNNGDRYHCNYPSVIELDLNNSGGHFKQQWFIQKKSFIQLPGNDRNLPSGITIEGNRQTVLLHNGSPTIELDAGNHLIEGSFTWPRLPEYLKIPQQSALVFLAVNTSPVLFPNLDSQGRLWLKQIDTKQKVEDRLQIESFRLIDDLIPARVQLFITLDVAGSAREISLGPLYQPNGFTPLSLKTSLPVKLAQDGRLKVQVRPGRYNISLLLRHRGPIHSLSFNPGSTPSVSGWPNQEIWSFRARPDLRLVEFGGVTAIDPTQTSIPPEWHNYPTFRVLPGETLHLKEIKRGDPLPAPDQLTLHRTLWLKFDGEGYTIQDRISGKKNTNWRLEMAPTIDLGRVAVDGKEVLITSDDPSAVNSEKTDVTPPSKAGVELRNGLVSLTADSIFNDGIASLPATGWLHDFLKVKGTLHLPPGWKLLHTRGIDNINNTWINKWTLLDFFIVLIFTIAVAKLFSKPLAVIGFATLLLSYHEPNAPRFIWLLLLPGITILRYLPTGKLRTVTKLYQGMMLTILFIIVIPYVVDDLRLGIYPQLAKPWTAMSDYAKRQEQANIARKRVDLPQVQMLNAPQEAMMEDDGAPVKTKVASKSDSSGYSRMKAHVLMQSAHKQVVQQDPKALTQTGPGLPKWLPFETIHFSWSGPVDQGQKIYFTLIGPQANLLLAIIRIVLITLLMAGLLGITFDRKNRFSINKLKQLFLTTISFFILLHPFSSQAQEFPSQQLLDQLQQRLLEKEKCFPSCSAIAKATIDLKNNTLVTHLDIDAQIRTVIPLPGHTKQWLPNKVLLNGIPADGLLRKDSGLWIIVPAGNSSLSMSGPLRQQNSLQLQFPLKPHHLSVSTKGWTVEGVHPDGIFDQQLQFRRQTTGEEKPGEIIETGILPPFLKVERTLLLGLVWKIQTTVTRVSPPGAAVVLEIPLLNGESVTTERIRVENGVAKLNMPSHQSMLTWESFLQPSDTISLTHAKEEAWTEIWKVDISPIFHLEYEGIPVILHKSNSRWYPTWHPWPGEMVKLHITRPRGMEGQTLTVEKSHLVLRPGQRSTSATLELSLKSSQGGKHAITLPAGSKLQEVKINSKIQPIRQEGRQVNMPVVPGLQRFQLTWLESRGMSTHYQSSDIDLGIQSVNTSLDIHLPQNRWPLFIGGEQLMTPAVLFWPVLIVVVIVALGLTRSGLTPLKFYQWLLLGIGLSMSYLLTGMIVTGWLIALNFRKKAGDLEDRRFNLIQVGLVFLTVAAAGSLLFAISKGLLGHPDMNIVGNGSHGTLLRWYHDISDPTLPQGWLFSIPMLVYRIAMLLWALWVSFWLVGVAGWGWKQFSTPQIWRPIKLTKDRSHRNKASGVDDKEKT